MKLYNWNPSGHGELSFFVVAEGEAQAVAYVEAEIALRKLLPIDDVNRITDYEVSGWGTDYYRLTVVDCGIVLTGENE